ncbi:MAG: hypothetical protein ABIF71_05020 [Planctomycetota bacterium]
MEPYLDKLGKTTGYLTNTVMHCPADHDTYIDARSYNSYAYNTSICYQGYPRRVPDDIRPKIALVADGYAYLGPWGDMRLYRHDTVRIDNADSPPSRAGHKGGTVNALFGDLRIENRKVVPNDERTW